MLINIISRILIYIMEIKMKILIIEEDKAEKSSFMHKFYDNLPQECKKKKDESKINLKQRVSRM